MLSAWRTGMERSSGGQVPSGLAEDARRAAVLPKESVALPDTNRAGVPVLLPFHTTAISPSRSLWSSGTRESFGITFSRCHSLPRATACAEGNFAKMHQHLWEAPGWCLGAPWLVPAC